MDNTKNMKLVISSPQLKMLNLELVQGRISIDEVDFAFDKNLDTKLISAVDKLLVRNKIDPVSLTSIKIAGHIDKNSSMCKMLYTWLLTVGLVKSLANS